MNNENQNLYNKRFQNQQQEIYDKMEGLYEEAKKLWKGVFFEILLEPIHPETGLQPERHILDYSKCMKEFGLNDGDPNKKLTVDELYTELNKLHDYKNILNAVDKSIANIQRQYWNLFNVILIRVLDPNNVGIDNSYDTDTTESAIEEEPESEEDLEEFVEDDSGVETNAEVSQELYSSEESETEYDSDSGQHTESSDDGNIQFSWDSDSEIDIPLSPELSDNPEDDLELNAMNVSWYSDSELNRMDSDIEIP